MIIVHNSMDSDTFIRAMIRYNVATASFSDTYPLYIVFIVTALRSYDNIKYF